MKDHVILLDGQFVADITFDPTRNPTGSVYITPDLRGAARMSEEQARERVGHFHRHDGGPPSGDLRVLSVEEYTTDQKARAVFAAIMK